ncbi:Secretion protein HlyD [Candidatus Magnetoovum chiemensis]|nr:Secretion protein HlyD [Candidatus Magnetoovum chiemensis]
MPPAAIDVAKVQTGALMPQESFIGTVYFQAVSELAAEVDGAVKEVMIEEGDRIKKDQVIVTLEASLLQKKLKATDASYKEVYADLKNANIELERIKKLYEKDTATKQTYDQNVFKAEALTFKSKMLEAQKEYAAVELEKTQIRSPINGVVIKKDADKGEWLSKGKVFAVIAKDDVVDIIAQVPQRALGSIKIGLKVDTRIIIREKPLILFLFFFFLLSIIVKTPLSWLRLFLVNIINKTVYINTHKMIKRVI